VGVVIDRNPAAAAAAEHDLIVVGGGVYGAALALEASRRGLRPLLLEREDFGGRTSWNSLRIVHGGLRYLQSLDLPRYRESVAERAWFLRTFPDLVRPLPCLMPLYGEGLRRRPLLGAALRIDEWLSRGRNRGVRADREFPSGRLLSVDQTVSMFAAVDRRGLCGGALWHDAVMSDSHRVIVEMLRWACRNGAIALNYVEAAALRTAAGTVCGVLARDVEGDRELEISAPVVVSCTGPWVRETAARFHRDDPALFAPSVAFNLFIDRDPPFSTAVAVAPRRTGGRVYFLHPWKGRVFAGTYHAPCDGATADDRPGDESIAAFLQDLNEAIPGMDFRSDEVLRVHWGHLPVISERSVRLTKRPVIRDHGASGGPRGLFSVCGVKFTTARRVAEDTLAVVARSCGLPRDQARLGDCGGPPRPRNVPDAARMRRLLSEDRPRAGRLVERIRSEEAVVHLDDLMLRRTDWGLLPSESIELRPALVGLVRAKTGGAG
jgi:glycerol-3-phosphate dehydrogenase